MENRNMENVDNTDNTDDMDKLSEHEFSAEYKADWIHSFQGLFRTLCRRSKDK